jgi:hypothetical protein
LIKDELVADAKAASDDVVNAKHSGDRVRKCSIAYHVVDRIQKKGPV